MGRDFGDHWAHVEGDPGRGRDGRCLFHHTLLHFPFFSLRWNFLRRLVQTSLHWITRLFLSAIRPTLSAPGLGAPGLGPDPGPAAVPLSLPPITKNRLLIWILGHLQARSFMWTQRTLSPRFKGSPRLLYTETTFTENLAQSPIVSISRTFTWTAMDTSTKYALVNTSYAEHLEILLFNRLSYHNPSCSISSCWSSDFLWLVYSRTRSLQKQVKTLQLNSWELHSSSADTHIPRIKGHLHTPNCWGYILRQFHTVSQCVMGEAHLLRKVCAT